MKLQGSLFKNYKEFKDSNSRPLNQVCGAPEREVQCSFRGYSPMQLAILPLYVEIGKLGSAKVKC